MRREQLALESGLQVSRTEIRTIGGHECTGSTENTAGQKVLTFPYQGGGNPRVEAQQAHVRFHAAVDHQMALPTGLPYQLAVD